MTRYEYRRVVINLNSSDEGLQQAGLEGWEAYAVIDVPGSAVAMHFLKRPLVIDDQPQQPQHRPAPALKRR